MVGWLCCMSTGRKNDSMRRTHTTIQIMRLCRGKEQNKATCSDRGRHALLFCARLKTFQGCRADATRGQGWLRLNLEPFRTAVPFWGQTTQNLTGLPPQRDRSANRVIRIGPCPCRKHDDLLDLLQLVQLQRVENILPFIDRSHPTCQHVNT